ncbi:MAG: sigma-70 family RNA polymerase sigma factor [Gemmatales bacterium]
MTVSERTESWETFYDAHAERLWRNVAQRIASSADVADVVQETMFAASRNFAQFNPNLGTPWNWLWGIGHRQVALHYRKRGRLPVLEQNIEPLVAWLESEQNAAHQTVVRQEWGELVRQSLSTLSAEYDDLLTARYLEERPVEDLARQAGQTEAAVRSKLARARAALREELLRRAPCLRGEQL